MFRFLQVLAIILTSIVSMTAKGSEIISVTENRELENSAAVHHLGSFSLLVNDDFDFDGESKSIEFKNENDPEEFCVIRKKNSDKEDKKNYSNEVSENELISINYVLSNKGKRISSKGLPGISKEFKRTNSSIHFTAQNDKNTSIDTFDCSFNSGGFHASVGDLKRIFGDRFSYYGSRLIHAGVSDLTKKDKRELASKKEVQMSSNHNHSFCAQTLKDIDEVAHTKSTSRAPARYRPKPPKEEPIKLDIPPKK